MPWFVPTSQRKKHLQCHRFPKEIPWFLRVFPHPPYLRWQEGISVGRRPVTHLKPPRKSFWKGGLFYWQSPKKKPSIYVRGKITIGFIDLHWISYFYVSILGYFSMITDGDLKDEIEVRLIWRIHRPTSWNIHFLLRQFSPQKEAETEKENNGNLQLNPSFLTPFSLWIPLQPLLHHMGDHQCRCFLSPHLASPSIRWPVSNNSWHFRWEEMRVVS